MISFRLNKSFMATYYVSDPLVDAGAAEMT